MLLSLCEQADGSDTLALMLTNQSVSVSYMERPRLFSHMTAYKVLTCTHAHQGALHHFCHHTNKKKNAFTQTLRA